MDNEKDKQNKLDDTDNNGIIPIKPAKIFNSNDSIEVNNLINLSNTDITPDILAQLEARAKEEQKKMDMADKELKKAEEEEQKDLNIPEGLPAEDGAVNITADILERPINNDNDSYSNNAWVVNNNNNNQETIDPLEEAKLNAVYKKYVIYINNENEKFIDSLSIEERKKLINKVLYEQNIISEQKKAELKKKESTIKTFISIITFLIAVPVIYMIFNVSMEATIQNYRHSKTNFEVLYKETGKIKINQ